MDSQAIPSAARDSKIKAWVFGQADNTADINFKLYLSSVA